jgi:hypothetical protein
MQLTNTITTITATELVADNPNKVRDYDVDVLFTMSSDILYVNTAAELLTVESSDGIIKT